MKLALLNPELVCFGAGLLSPHMHVRHEAPSLAAAQGLRFSCPACARDPDGPHDHRLCVPFRDRGVPPDENGGHQWAVAGSCLADLTLTPSIHSVGHWHGWIRNGEVTDA